VATAGSETLRVVSPQGTLLFEYESGTGKTRVYLPEGDMELACAGSLRLSAAAIDLAGSGGVRMAAGEPGRAQSQVAVRPGELTLAAPRATIVAQQLDATTGETRLSGERFRGCFRHVGWLAERVETLAGTIAAAAQNICHTAKELLLTRAGRSRTEVEQDARLTAETIVSRSREDTKLMGRQIHLG
jgi:hypothetical protein